jgi:hypothetical protein
VRHAAVLRLAFASHEEAARVAAALAPENAGYVRVRVEGAVLHAEADAESPLSLLHALDDVLACAAAAEKAGRVAERA